MTSSNGSEFWDWRAAMPELASISNNLSAQPNVKTEEFVDHYKVIAKFPGSVRDNIRIQIHEKAILLSTTITPNMLHSRTKSGLKTDAKLAKRAIEHKIEFSTRVSSKLVHRHFQNGVLILILAKR
ncbi:hypothetical protein FE810_16510 [Thalassotalea litorea]|uniref:Hsp20/alpha crystallin family protein n=1 Tax=Thalassotalea litorea TaxID=2020715 RepID=A0A5R9IC32_9GAMM|nr:Hsp20/alpha crystallin family protein [Thalassotalea litorea]TLU59943.1 hypothetical protein FE810_16510 [Thalassotalea litorea]